MFEQIFMPLIEGSFILFGNIKCFGEYMMQPVSRLGEHFVSSYSTFDGTQIAFSMPNIEIVDTIGDLIATLSQDTQIWLALSILTITLGLVIHIIVKIVKMILAQSN